jgi:hypothetical protein
MPATLQQKLKEKGWSDDEVDNALNIIYSPEKQEKHAVFTEFSSPLVYWSLLIVAIIGNFIASVVLIPIMLFLTRFQLYAVIFLLAISFGAFFNLLLKDIEHVDYKHHIMGGVFIPAIAFINVYVIVNLANTLNDNVFSALFSGNGIIHQSPILITIIYVIGFIIPYLAYKTTDLLKNHRAELLTGVLRVRQLFQHAK